MNIASARGQVAAFLAVVLAAVLAVGAPPLGAGSASAVTASAAETRVGASTSAVIDTVGSPAGISAGQRLGSTVLQPQIVVATAVAAETANEGIYVVRSEAGNYVGQSGNITQRLAQHVSTGKFTQAEVDAAERFAVSGGKTAREIAEQLKIDSPEFGGIDNLLNKVNPIGVRRLDLMPDGYTR